MWQFRSISSSSLPGGVPTLSVLGRVLLSMGVQFEGAVRGTCCKGDAPKGFREGPRGAGPPWVVDGPLGSIKAIAHICQVGKLRSRDRKGLAHSHTVYH